MSKLHTRQKRKLRMRHGLGGRDRAKRPKTFKSEAAAKKHAESTGRKDYKIVNLKSPEAKSKKLRIV